MLKPETKINSVLNYSCINDLQTLYYSFQNIRNVDDIALHLLNESVPCGFLPAVLNKDSSRIEFNTEKKIPCTNEAVFNKAEDLYCILTDLKDAMSEMAHCRIDMRYLVCDENAVYRDADTGFFSFAVVPCTEITENQASLKDILMHIISEAAARQMISAEAEQQLTQCVSSSETEKMIPDMLQIMTDHYPQCASVKRVRVDTDTVVLPVILPVIPEEVPLEIREEEVQEEEAREEEVSEETDAEETAGSETILDAEYEIIDEEETETAEETEQAESEIPEETEQTVNEAPEEIKQAAAHVEDEEWMNRLREAIREEIMTEKQLKRNAFLLRSGKGEIFSLADDVFIIGKNPKFCDYVISDNPAISKLHAIIRYDEADDSYYIVDCDSTNHTYLNGKKIPSEQAVKLEDQMVIHMASEAFIFRR